MNIKKFSELTNISAHTIRYYEKVGLLKQISRNASGHRCFTQDDIAWVEFIKRLKDTGMPLNIIRKYTELRNSGEQTAELRMQLLQEHTKILEERIAIESSHLEKLKEKIAYYSEVIDN